MSWTPERLKKFQATMAAKRRKRPIRRSASKRVGNGHTLEHQLKRDRKEHLKAVKRITKALGALGSLESLIS